ncbi:DNA-binding protein Alba [Candidatus Nanobsidianus stetteri]|uniref:DNA/RNA-binding protein Alba n=1 Tax=Nanobsidianus stetteri TaxID=1294122 RepID=A0A2T9WSF7_NANST|nr:DNA-binding protein Alba [Candidatus Nanobsidianus stetteri]PVU70024.1 DNA-binding protein Alba [Candidatus Nanobsidianus stetteri]PVU70766.1 DNA-binding protein Alba [Candidatus Nanobsidianus stetteri]
MAEQTIIYIGNKPFMNYVTAVAMQFTSQDAKEVVIKARGRYISRAVDVAEVVRKKFMAGQVDIKSISIDSEERQVDQSGKKRRISSIEIVLVKKQ